MIETRRLRYGKQTAKCGIILTTTALSVVQ